MVKIMHRYLICGIFCVCVCVCLFIDSEMAAVCMFFLCLHLCL